MKLRTHAAKTKVGTAAANAKQMLVMMLQTQKQKLALLPAANAKSKSW